MAKRGATKSGAAKPGPAPSKPGTYFASLTVCNVRCFGDEPQTLSFVDQSGRLSQWTILLGENGTGKTTLLTVLASLENDKRLNLQELMPGRYWFPTLLLLQSSIEGRNVFGRRGVNHLSIVAEMCASPGLGQLGTSAEKSVASFHWTRSLEGVDHKETSLSTGVPIPPPCYGYGAGRRIGHRTSSDDRAGAEASLASLLDDHSGLRDVEAWLLALDYSGQRSNEIGEQLKWLERVMRVLIDLLPGDVKDIRFGSTTGPAPEPRVEFRTPDGWVSIYELAYGYQTTLAWVVDLISRMMERHPNSPDPLAEPAVVLVDEIDLHLHPSWQRELVRKLPDRFPNTQFIATAHSPLIVQAAAEVGANLAVLRREGDHVVIDNDVDRIRGWTVDQILTSNLFGLATARPPALEPKIARRSALLSKPTLTAKDEAEVKRLESEIGVLPGGATFDDAKRMLDIIEESNRLASKYLEREP